MNQKFSVFLFLLLLLVIACKDKKKVSLSGEDPIEVTDFIDAFQPINLPFQLQDSSVMKKNQDSLWISYKIFSQFVPDTVLAKAYGKEQKIKIYPIGKAGEDQTFLFARAVSGNRRTSFVICFDRKNNFIAGMPAIIPDADPATRQSFGVDPKMTITKLTARKNVNGTTSEAKDVFVLNEQAKNFLLINTVNPDATNLELINPIDTFSRKNKFSGDYTRQPKNLVSIRDNKKAGRFTFFIHFEKNEGECIGEVKGEASFISATEAVFKSNSDPCHLQFQFTSSSVTITEENCGSHRGSGCVFAGTYPKKKEAKKPKKKK